MEKKDKELLLKDLCARYPYKIICKLSAYGTEITEQLELGGLGQFMYGRIDVKPYLRKMSSMTEEEREEWTDLFMVSITQEWEQYADEFEAEKVAPSLFAKSHTLSIDWLNKNHFDSIYILCHLANVLMFTAKI